MRNLYNKEFIEERDRYLREYGAAYRTMQPKSSEIPTVPIAVLEKALDYALDIRKFEIEMY
jgi:hypothetical protein